MLMFKLFNLLVILFFIMKNKSKYFLFNTHNVASTFLLMKDKIKVNKY